MLKSQNQRTIMFESRKMKYFLAIISSLILFSSIQLSFPSHQTQFENNLDKKTTEHLQVGFNLRCIINVK